MKKTEARMVVRRRLVKELRGYLCEPPITCLEKDVMEAWQEEVGRIADRIERTIRD